MMHCFHFHLMRSLEGFFVPNVSLRHNTSKLGFWEFDCVNQAQFVMMHREKMEGNQDFRQASQLQIFEAQSVL